MVPLTDCAQRVPLSELGSPARYSGIFFANSMNSLFHSFMKFGAREFGHPSGNRKFAFNFPMISIIIHYIFDLIGPLYVFKFSLSRTYLSLIQKETNNWVLQFLEYKTEIFLVL